MIAVLTLLARKGEMSGRDLRKALENDFSIKMSGPGFYQLMAGMEDDGLVTMEKRKETLNGHEIAVQYYEATTKGKTMRKFQSVEDAKHEAAGLSGGEATTKLSK